MKVLSKIVILRDWKKRLFQTHTLESASVLPDSSQLTDRQLENVIGGMSSEQFEKWRLEKINESW